MRPACPPLLFSCRFLNFSRSRSEMDLAARRAIYKLTGATDPDLAAFLDSRSSSYAGMIDHIGEQLNLTTLRYQTLADMIDAIGLPQESLCTFCWSGQG